MNMAQVWKLPVIFVCENNLYGEFSHILHTTPYENLVTRAAGYSMQTELVDGNDVLAVYDAAVPAASRARDGEGATFIECKTYRHRGHSRTDPAKYRHQAEVEAWLRRDPISLYRAELQAAGLMSDAGGENITAEARSLVKAAADRAAAAPWPSSTQDFLARTSTHWPIASSAESRRPADRIYGSGLAPPSPRAWRSIRAMSVASASTWG
jgi:pyruvate dehydrogenase E1 component alpha subunit